MDLTCRLILEEWDKVHVDPKVLETEQQMQTLLSTLCEAHITWTLE